MNRWQLAEWVVLLSLLADGAVLLGAYLLFRRYLRVRRENTAMRQTKEVIYNFVHDVGEVFAESDFADLDALLQKVLFYALRTTRAGAGAIYMLEPDGRSLRARALSGLFPPLHTGAELELGPTGSKSDQIEQLVRATRLEKGVGVLGEAADLGAPLLVEDAELDPRLPRFEEDYLRIRSLVAVPMRFHHKVHGVLAVINRTDGAAFTESDQNLLQALADQASVSVHFAKYREALNEKKRLDYDLSVARRIQAMLLPAQLPQLPDVEVAAANDPAQQIGGDYYDYIRVDEDHLGLIIADVSGKGIGGAIVMSMCRSAVRARAPHNLSPAHLLKAVNRVLAEDLTEDMFVTALYLVLNLRTRELTFARAGHERPLLRARDGVVRPLDAPGMAMGLDDGGAFDAVIQDVRLTLAPGELLAAYTDGITEARNAAGEEWGPERLADTLRLAADDTAGQCLTRIRQRVLRFVDRTPQYDDMTLLTLRVR